VEVSYLSQPWLDLELRKVEPGSIDFITVVSGALEAEREGRAREILPVCVEALKEGGVLFVQGTPELLPEIAASLERSLKFCYWIVVESTLRTRETGLPSSHAGVLLYSKGTDSPSVKRIRLPHQSCAYCGRTLKDWGGKAHLMHAAGYVVSDVIKDLPKRDNYHYISAPLLRILFRFVEAGKSRGKGIVIPLEGISFDEISSQPKAEMGERVGLGVARERVTSYASENVLSENLIDVVHQGDVVKVLRGYPDNSVDLAFADPPYNLEKSYNAYDDAKADEAYIDWCNSWLYEYARVLKPTGSLYILNLPKWAIHHATFLNQHLYFQNWIAWDALADPRGKVLPAHYALLFYTKHPTNFTFNYAQVGRIDSRSFCLRRSCIRRRKEEGIDPKEPLTDIWWDIHRIKHKRERDAHPCQLPERLMERIILLSSNEGDIVLDGLCGTGTTPVVAAALHRRYIAADIDERYVEITRQKIAEVKASGYVHRETVRRRKRAVTKKELQEELRALAKQLGRLPTEEDVKARSRYDIEIFQRTFATWGKALKAAKLEVQDESRRTP